MTEKAVRNIFIIFVLSVISEIVDIIRFLVAYPSHSSTFVLQVFLLFYFVSCMGYLLSGYSQTTHWKANFYIAISSTVAMLAGAGVMLYLFFSNAPLTINEFGIRHLLSLLGYTILGVGMGVLHIAQKKKARTLTFFALIVQSIVLCLTFAVYRFSAVEYCIQVILESIRAKVFFTVLVHEFWLFLSTIIFSTAEICILYVLYNRLLSLGRVKQNNP